MNLLNRIKIQLFSLKLFYCKLKVINTFMSKKVPAPLLKRGERRKKEKKEVILGPGRTRLWRGKGC